MKKDAYYFPHFSNARNDSKLVRIRRIYGIEGYGLYYMLLEVLREQTEFRLPLESVEDLAFEWHISKEKILSIIADFELFEIIDNTFFSPKLILYLQPYIERSERGRLAAKVRWDNVKSDANALQMHNKCNADQNTKKVKESKVKESIKYIYNEFYDSELELSNNNPEYKQFVEFLFGKNSLKEKLTGVLSVKNQLTFEQFEKAVDNCKANNKKLGTTLLKIENDKKYYKGKIRLAVVLNNWITDKHLKV